MSPQVFRQGESSNVALAREWVEEGAQEIKRRRVESDQAQKQIVIKKSEKRLYMLENGEKIFSMPVSLGRSGARTRSGDFAILDKPCLYLNYDPVDNSIFKVKDVFNFEHFRSMDNLEAVGWINSKNEISNRILTGLNISEKIGKERKEWLKRIVLHPIDNNSNELSKSILNKF